MSKITTEDCVKALVAKFGDSGWKRRNKVKWNNGILRVFECSQTQSFWGVYEELGRIADIFGMSREDVAELKTSKKPVAPIYYVLHKAEGSIGVSVTDSKHFDTKGCQSDWTPEGTFEELERLGYPGSEMMEGMIEFHNEVEDIEDLKSKLASSPVFKFNPAFQDFLGGVCEESDEDNEEFQVIRI